MEQREPFWMVYGLGQGAPTARHDTYGSAAQEAQRLARNNPGIVFYILATVGKAIKVDVEVKRISLGYDSDDDLPF